MKKIALFMSALALLLTTSCNDNKGADKPNLDDVIEDGFFVAGPATGSAEIVAKNMMTAGFNEVTKEARDGMYEKYIVLQGGQDFYLTLNEAGNSIRYSADLQKIDLASKADEPAYADNPKILIDKGELIAGDGVKSMQVEKTGLYHIVLDLNKAQDLAFAQIVIAPCEFRLKGQLEKPMELKVEGDKYIYTYNNPDHQNATSFKFVSCDGWKITLDVDGKVKAETSLGLTDKGLMPNGADIPLNPGDNVTITLTYQAAAGDLSRNFSYKFDGVKEDYGPADFTVGLVGGLHSSVPEWGDPVEGSTKAVYDASASTPDKGIYVYNIKGLPIKEGAEFKFRRDGDWIGAGANFVEVKGINVSGTDNFKMGSKGAKYDVKITLAWDGKAASSFIAEFTEAGELPAEVEKKPEDLVVGVSGSFAGENLWVDPAGKYRAVYSKEESDEAAKKYVYNITGLVLATGDQLKFRFNGSWEGVGFQPLEGITLGAEGDNFKVEAAAAGTYDVKFTGVWDGSAFQQKTVTFTKK